MKICTFNVNSIKARKELVLNWLEHRKYDIDLLCFQELKQLTENFPYEDFNNLGFNTAVFGQKAYNGVAICSNQPLKNIQYGFNDDKWDEQKRVISAEYHDFCIINVYVPRGDLPGNDKFLYKQEWYEKFSSFLIKNYSAKDPLMIVGDFNVAKEDLDVYSPEELKGTVGTLPEERNALGKLLNWGLHDVVRTLYPEKQQFTWWGYMGGAIWKDQGMRIDYVLCTETLLDRIISAEVDLWPRRKIPTPSDHAPLIVEIKDRSR